MKSEETAADNRGGDRNKSIFRLRRIVTTSVTLGLLYVAEHLIKLFTVKPTLANHLS